MVASEPMFKNGIIGGSNILHVFLILNLEMFVNVIMSQKRFVR